MGALDGLPRELILSILSSLATESPPNVECLREEPSLALLTSEQCPLKNLSLTCWYLRRLCFNSLFSHFKIDAGCTDAFKSFVDGNDLRRSVESVVLYTTEQATKTDPRGGLQDLFDPNRNTAANLQIQSAVVMIIEHINPKSLTIFASPLSFTALVPYELNLSDSWAFNISHQILRLEQDKSATTPCTSSFAPAFDILAICPWQHITYNEGSSIPAYSTYEYFHKRTPSLFGTSPYGTVPKRGPGLAHLTSFDYVAIFPFDRMKGVYILLKELHNLKHLRTQLAPSAMNGVLDDPVAMGKGQRSDLWAEFEMAHCELFRYIQMEAQESLTRYTVLDYTTPELRRMIDGAELNVWPEAYWRHDGNGSWTKHLE